MTEPEIKPPMPEPTCDLCGDQPETLHLHARCHLTAPLSAELAGGVLTLRCYVPDCRRVVARLRVAEILTREVPHAP